MEAVHQIEDFKENIKMVNRKEEELVSVIEAINNDKHISSASYTLDIMVKKFRSQSKLSEQYKERVEILEKANFDLSRNLNKSKLDH
jgi:hypothetical protein